MKARLALFLAVVPLADCSSARNYTDPLTPRYTGGVRLAARAGDTLKVVAFNIEFALHVDSAIALIRSTPALRDPDILLLQEMDVAGTRMMAEALGLDYVYYPATVHPNTRRDFGDAILSRYPIEADRKIILPHLARPNHTQREAVGATIRVGERLVRIYSVHLGTMIDNGPGARREQLAAVLADAQAYPLVVLGGDFNSGSVPGIALARGFIWPTHRLGRTHAFWDMDHVLLKGLTVTGAPSVGMVRNVHGASDHKPVWARVVVPSGAGAILAAH